MKINKRCHYYALVNQKAWFYNVNMEWWKRSCNNEKIPDLQQDVNRVIDGNKWKYKKDATTTHSFIKKQYPIMLACSYDNQELQRWKTLNRGIVGNKWKDIKDVMTMSIEYIDTNNIEIRRGAYLLRWGTPLWT